MLVVVENGYPGALTEQQVAIVPRKSGIEVKIAQYHIFQFLDVGGSVGYRLQDRSISVLK